MSAMIGSLFPTLPSGQKTEDEGGNADQRDQKQ
jgi:hypothetical protein